MQWLSCAVLARIRPRNQVFWLLAQLLSFLPLCGTDWPLTIRSEDWAETETPLSWWLSCIQHGPFVWDQGWPPRWTNQPHEERRVLSSMRRVPCLLPMHYWKFLALEKSCRAAFLTIGELRTYVLSIFGTWLTKLVSLYLSNSLATCPSVSWPFFR